MINLSGPFGSHINNRHQYDGTRHTDTYQPDSSVRGRLGRRGLQWYGGGVLSFFQLRQSFGSRKKFPRGSPFAIFLASAIS
jgi:hypothetical protein